LTRWIPLEIGLLISVTTGVIAEEPAAVTLPAATEAQIQGWIGELDADRFIVRELATENLLQAGVDVIEHVAAAAKGPSLEVGARCVYVLRELALARDRVTESAAREALGQLARDSEAPAGQRAARTLITLRHHWQSRALEELQGNGAVVGGGQAQPGFNFGGELFSLEIGADWKGDPDALRQLKWLVDLQRITLVGKQVDDGWMQYLQGLENLQAVHLKRTTVRGHGLGELQQLPSLTHVDIWYSPIDDESVPKLSTMGRLQSLRMYGTQVSSEGAQRIEQALPGTHIDYRKGAFLGVGCEPNELGCRITLVHPGSAAAKADIRQGDILVKYDGKQVVDFENLTKVISENAGGDTVTMEILRGEEQLVKEVALGEWK
jgi:hypothetical protein